VKCLTLCSILVCCAHAGVPTSVAITSDPAQLAQAVAIRATVTGKTTITGTVAFTTDGAAIAGCSTVSAKGGIATCNTKFPRLGTFTIGAAYSGDTFGDPSSGTASITVAKVVPWAYLASAPAVPVYGGPLIVNALVLGAAGVAAPTGTVTFSEAGVELITRPLGDDGRAGLGMPLNAGAHTVVAVYNGDANYTPSASIKIVVSVTKGPPVVAISTTPAQIRQPVTITVSVLPAGAVGTVTFSGVPACTAVPLQNGIATCGAIFMQLGELAITGTYSGDSNLLGGAASMKLNVGRVVAGVFVATAPDTPVYGETFRVNALLLGAQGVAAPTGQVLFQEAASIAAIPLNADGRASWSTTVGIGSHSFTATYNGDTNYGTSQGVATIMVSKANTRTTLTATPGGDFTAVVDAVAPGSGAPTGGVRFLRDGDPIASVALTRIGATSVATLAGSAEGGRVTAEYGGDLNFNGSVSGAVAVLSPRVDVTVTSDRNPAAAGSVTFAATVVPNPGTAAPTGIIRFSVDGAVTGSVPLVKGGATSTMTLAAGSHAVGAEYSGDSTYPAASGRMTQVVTAPASTLTLTADAQSVIYGQAVTFTAQLPGSATGAVRFSDNGVPLGSASLSAGTASMMAPALAAGTHTIAASWDGGTAAAQIVVVVGQARTVTSLSLRSGTASVIVSAVAPGAGTPTGTVRLVNAANSAPIAILSLTAGVATVRLDVAGPVLAVYIGDENFVGSISAPASPLVVANAGSYASTEFAPDEIVTIFGPNLAGATSAKVTDSAGVVRTVAVLYAAAEQASMVLPGDLAIGPATVTIAGLTAAITVAQTAPGLFTTDASGSGAPVGQALRVGADGGQDTEPVDAVEFGDGSVYLVLYGTGIRHAAQRPACAINGRSVEVVFAGAQGAFAGLDQVNLLLPPELRGIGAASLVLTADGIASNAVTVTFR
jgi:uncharacterized protein (TIGR03437 family)